MRENLEKLVYQYIVENSYPEENVWCTMAQMSKTLKEFPGTLRPIVQELDTRGVISYYRDATNEYMGYNEPDIDWTEDDLMRTIHLYDGEF